MERHRDWTYCGLDYGTVTAGNVHGTGLSCRDYVVDSCEDATRR